MASNHVDDVFLDLKPSDYIQIHWVNNYTIATVIFVSLCLLIGIAYAVHYWIQKRGAQALRPVSKRRRKAFAPQEQSQEFFIAPAPSPNHFKSFETEETPIRAFTEEITNVSEIRDLNDSSSSAEGAIHKEKK